MSERWGVVIVPIDELGNIWSISPLSENYGKREMVASFHQSKASFEDKREYPAGAIEINDGELYVLQTLFAAAGREVAEETGIIPCLSNLSKTDFELTVLQDRDDREYEFKVATMRWMLTSVELEWLHNYCGAEIVHENEDNEYPYLRPRDEAITGLMFGVFNLNDQFASVEYQF